MAGALALVSAALALSSPPPLPARGLAHETKAGVELQTLSGRALATLSGLDLAPDQAIAHTVVMRDTRGRLFVLDRNTRRLHEARRRHGCRATDVELVVCARTIRRGSRVVARAPAGSPSGHWVWAERAPRGDAILAQWEAECEVPVAYLVVRGAVRAYARESVALGWLPDGAAVIHYPNGPCGGSIHVRGIYAVPLKGKPRLVQRTPRFAQYLMWGG
jgi:hypothetical protein